MEEEKSGPPNDKEELRGPSKCFFPLPLPRGIMSPKLGWVEQEGGEKGRKRKSKTRAGCDSWQGEAERRAGGESKGERKTQREGGWRGESGGKAEEHPSPDSPSPALWGAASSEPFIDWHTSSPSPSENLFRLVKGSQPPQTAGSPEQIPKQNTRWWRV